MWYAGHMKRTNLVLDGDLLERATTAFGVKTYSAAVNLALAEAMRFRQIQNIPQFFGQGLWEGDLSQMRDDKPREDPQRARRAQAGSRNSR